MTKQNWLYIGLAVYGILAYLAIIGSVRAGYATFTFGAALCASPALLAFLAVVIESRKFTEVANPVHGPWSFLIGDTFVLTSALALIAIAWRSIPHQGWIMSWWWSVSTAAIGVAFGFLFHWFDGQGYRAAGAGNRLTSPTKMAHDFVSVPVLLAALLCVGVPVLVHWSNYSLAALLCVLLWAGLVARDTTAGLDPFHIHPGWDSVNFQVVPDEPSRSP